MPKYDSPAKMARGYKQTLMMCQNLIEGGTEYRVDAGTRQTLMKLILQLQQATPDLNSALEYYFSDAEHVRELSQNVDAKRLRELLCKCTGYDNGWRFLKWLEKKSSNARGPSDSNMGSIDDKHTIQVCALVLEVALESKVALPAELLELTNKGDELEQILRDTPLNAKQIKLLCKLLKNHPIYWDRNDLLITTNPTELELQIGKAIQYLEELEVPEVMPDNVSTIAPSDAGTRSASAHGASWNQVAPSGLPGIPEEATAAEAGSNVTGTVLVLHDAAQRRLLDAPAPQLSGSGIATGVCISAMILIPCYLLYRLARALRKRAPQPSDELDIEETV